MQLSELVTAVQGIIQDDSFTNEDITTHLNTANLEIAGGVQSALGDWITPPLPDLFTIDTITTSINAAYVEMPEDFQRNLQLVASSDGNEIDIAESFISFSSTYPLLNKTGAVVECCEFGGKFYYQGIPSVASVITIHYFRLPENMVNDADEPDGIPLHLQRELLVNHACWKIFELIEDGLEGEIPNTQKYMDRFFRAVKLLELFIPYETRSLILG
jgi:hypothetical protein